MLALSLVCFVDSVTAGDIDQVTISTLSFSQHEQGKSASAVMHGEQQYWLTTSANQGLRLYDVSGEELSRIVGNYESLSVKTFDRDDNESAIIAAVEVETDSIQLFTIDWQHKALIQKASFTNATAQTEALCWYADADYGVSLFSVDAIGVTKQHLIDVNNLTATPKLIREFPGVPKPTACATDTASQALYIAEETVGVWRYPANPEMELARDLVITTAPHGRLSGEIKGIATLPNQYLLVSTPDESGVWIFPANDHNKAEFIALQDDSAPESINTVRQNQQSIVSVFDDEHDVYYTFSLHGAEPHKDTADTIFDWVTPAVETTPVKKFGDAADDPAIWLNPDSPEASLVFGTNKKQGLLVYNLSGDQIAEYNVGRVNNVDLLYNFSLNGNAVDLVAASNRTNKSISLFAILNANGTLEHLGDYKTGLNDVYGLCSATVNQTAFVYINDTDGRFEQYQIQSDSGKLSTTLVRSFSANSQPEGCVVDAAENTLYFGEESFGIWQVSALPNDDEPNVFQKLNDKFIADVEGMEIYQMGSNKYLIASSQGNNSYAIFSLSGNRRYLGSFKIKPSIERQIDAVSETDGLAIVSQGLGERFPDGLLVVQDGRNHYPTEPQNFKYVSGTYLKDLISKLER